MRYLPAPEVPPATQRMWEVALGDMERAEGLLDAAMHDPTATEEYKRMRQHDAKVRRNICKVINFIITNADDVNAVIKAKQAETESHKPKG